MAVGSSEKFGSVKQNGTTSQKTLSFIMQLWFAQGRSKTRVLSGWKFLYPVSSVRVG